jgi:hypothetical protein
MTGAANEGEGLVGRHQVHNGIDICPTQKQTSANSAVYWSIREKGDISAMAASPDCCCSAVPYHHKLWFHWMLLGGS